MAFMAEFAEDMDTWGGKWRNRWRTNKSKCKRVASDFLSTSETKIVRSPGGYMDDLWKKRIT